MEPNTEKDTAHRPCPHPYLLFERLGVRPNGRRIHHTRVRHRNCWPDETRGCDATTGERPPTATGVRTMVVPGG